MRGLDLYEFAKEDESHVLVLGASGTGKTVLMKSILAKHFEERILVVDYLGNYAGWAKYHAPLPLNPLEFIPPKDVIDAIRQAIITAYGENVSAITPAVEYILEGCMEEGAGSVPELIACVSSKKFAAPDEENARKAAVRRLQLYNNQLWARRTHKLLKAWLEGEVSASLAINLRGASLWEAVAYVYMLLTIIARWGSGAGAFLVVDEAHYYARGTALEEALRVARNYGIYIAAITQTAKGMREELLDLFKVVVEFPTVDLIRPRAVEGRGVGARSAGEYGARPHTAVVTALITNAKLMAKLGSWPEAPVYRAVVEVKPWELKKPEGGVSASCNVRQPCYRRGKIVDYLMGGDLLKLEVEAAAAYIAKEEERAAEPEWVAKRRGA